MARENFNDLLAFVIVAREGSFTRAAAYGGLYAWECEKDGHELKVRVEGRRRAACTGA
jgi:hypothetical protein